MPQQKIGSCDADMLGVQEFEELHSALRLLYTIFFEGVIKTLVSVKTTAGQSRPQTAVCWQVLYNDQNKSDVYM